MLEFWMEEREDPCDCMTQTLQLKGNENLFLGSVDNNKKYLQHFLLRNTQEVKHK